MKLKIIAVFLGMVVRFGCLAQDNIPLNVHCYGAERFCQARGGTNFNQTFSLEGTNWCANGSVRLFYKFYPTTTINSNEMSLHAFTTPCEYTLYGPFSSTDDLCTQYAQLSAPVLAHSSGADSSHTVDVDVPSGSWYLLEVKVVACNGQVGITMPSNTLLCETETLACESCIESFQPKNGQFILSAWVKEDLASTEGVTTYSHSKIVVTGGVGPEEFFPSGQIIDGWQRIEGVFTASSLGDISVQLESMDGDAYFDDIRIFPYDGSMMSYVYDPVTLRLMAELDERNYAKFYEYDEEGKLVRVKKETEKGVMTIQENRDNNSKQ
jgi:hypothetical protein